MDVDLSDSGYGQVAGYCERGNKNTRVPQNAETCLASWRRIIFWWLVSSAKTLLNTMVVIK